MASFWDWVPKLLPTVIAAGATIYGANQASKAQDKAAETARQANQQATDAQLQALRLAEQNQQRMQAVASPGLMRVQSVIGRGDQLTPEQMLALQDARRTTVDTLQGSGLRGSARATAATINDVEGRMRTGFMAQNRNQADNAAQALSGQYFNAGNSIANLNQQAGNAVSQGLLNTGQADVNSMINQGSIKGQAIGNIGAVIADQFKSDDQKERDRVYSKIEEKA